MSQQRPYRKFRPLQESISIVEKMLAVAAYYSEGRPLFERSTDKSPKDRDEIEYWERRLHGYLKLAAQQNVKVKSMLRDESDKGQ